MPTRQGCIRLFRLFGIEVFLHWSWFLIAIYDIQSRTTQYKSIVWNVLEYLTLFLIVLIHEFGHSLACRQVGGQANQIVLWPLGGVAYVSPPQRPGAQLWSIVAGPLVNVILFPIFSVIWWLGYSANWMETFPSVYVYVMTIWYINTVLLIFNLMPVYPLDGGQILRSLLWFVFGRARSLLIASSIGFVGVALLILFALWARSVWIGIMALFILLNCWGGLMHARALARAANAPRHDGFACPACGVPPPFGNFWGCGRCRTTFDTFATQGVCPNCGTQFAVTSCPECGSQRPLSEWVTATNVPPRL